MSSDNRPLLSKLRFVQNEKIQIIQQRDDLETSLDIHKQTIRQLLELTKDSSGSLSPETILKSHVFRETELLNEQLRRATEQRDELQSTLLLKEQLISDLEKKEKDFGKELEDAVAELRDNLEQKEFFV